MAILDIQNLTFTFAERNAPALKDVSFNLEKGSFAVLAGATGSGKSTLMRLIKRELSPRGERNGSIIFDGQAIEEMSDRDAASRIGYVCQRPDEQIVTDKVWHELAFGLENLGTSKEEIASRIAEMAAFFGIEDWYDRDVCTLSGGEKQLLSLASVMVMRPQMILLDEPTSKLDPIAAAGFMEEIRKINSDLGVTVLIAEHRLDDCLPLADTLIVLETGRLLTAGDRDESISRIRGNETLMQGMPAVFRLFNRLGSDVIPLTVRDGRKLLFQKYEQINGTEQKETEGNTPPALELKNVYFRYEKDSPDILKDMNLTVREGQIHFLLGGNGSGKSTLLSLASALHKPYTGEVKVYGKPVSKYKEGTLYDNCLSMLPQDVQTLFTKDSVREELSGIADPVFDLTHLFGSHPYDLSGGEQQKLAFSLSLASKPKMLLLDEPTKGLDAVSKKELGDYLLKLKASGTTILIVTHDLEFAAEYGDRVSLLFRGRIVSEGTPEEFFLRNSFYTTAAVRLTGGTVSGAVTVKELGERLKEKKA